MYGPSIATSFNGWPQARSCCSFVPATFEQELMEYSPTHGSYHWIAERAISVGLIPLTLAPFAAGSLNPTTDAILIAAIVLHTHIGFQYVLLE